jgi:hypothetical protein
MTVNQLIEKLKIISAKGNGDLPVVHSFNDIDHVETYQTAVVLIGPKPENTESRNENS